MEITSKNEISTAIDSSIPDAEKMEKFLNDLGNPYCFKCGDMTVRLRFAEDEKTLALCLIKYFKSLKTY